MSPFVNRINLTQTKIRPTNEIDRVMERNENANMFNKFRFNNNKVNAKSKISAPEIGNAFTAASQIVDSKP